MTTVLTGYDRMKMDLELKNEPFIQKVKDKNHSILNYGWEDYRIIKRASDFEPFVVCFMYDFNTNTWGQGHYFDDLIDAIEFLYYLKHR